LGALPSLGLGKGFQFELSTRGNISGNNDGGEKTFSTGLFVAVPNFAH
jgi:hypothetical protein